MTDTMHPPEAEQLLQDLVQQLLPHVTGPTSLVGIHSGGAWLAQRLHSALGLKTPLGTLDISFYRDDFSKIGLHPQVKPSDIPFDVADRDIILVDDVLHTGRTVRAAMNELFDYGRPASIRLAVLVDRGGRELPICPDFVGARINLSQNQNLQLTQGEDGKFKLSLFSDN